jgi:ribosomal protein S18 acetylase RimI-like enzyme
MVQTSLSLSFSIGRECDLPNDGPTTPGFSTHVTERARKADQPDSHGDDDERRFHTEHISYSTVSQVDVRHARPAELRAILELLDELGRPCADPDSAVRRSAEEILEREDTEVLIAECDGEVAGLACLLVLPRLGHATPEARLLDLVVSRDRRAYGVGRALVAMVGRRASSSGCHLLRLECGHQREGAKRFYERLGFESRGEDWQLQLPVQQLGP